MFVSICSINFNPDGALYLEVTPDNNLESLSRRTSKTPTLDGGVSIDDFGPGYADEDFQFTLVEPSKDQVRILRAFVEYETAVTLSTEMGFYIVSPSDISVSGGEVQLTLLVQEKQQ